MAECATSASDSPVYASRSTEAGVSPADSTSSPGTQPNSSSALTVCTIASSVSTLAVSENSLPGLAGTLDQDSPCCPPKRKCISVNVTGDIQFEPFDLAAQSDSSPRLFCESEASVMTGTYRNGESLGRVVDVTDVVSTTVSCVKPECSYFDLVGSRLSEKARAEHDTMQGVDSMDLQTETGLESKPGARRMQHVKQLFCGDDAEGWSGTGCTSVSSTDEAAKVTHHAQTPSPYHCHVFDGRFAGSDAGGKQLRRQIFGDGTDSHNGLAGHASTDSHSGGQTGVLVSNPEWSVGKPSSSCCGARAPGSLCCGGDAPRPELSRSKGDAPESAYSSSATAADLSSGLSITTVVESAPSLGSEVSSTAAVVELKNKGAAPSLRIDFTQFSSGSSVFLNTSKNSSCSLQGTKTSECQDFGAGALTSSTECGTDVPSVNDMGSSVPTLSTDCEYEKSALKLSTDYEYETDTSGCSDSSSDATASSSDSCTDQSVPSVSSARISSQKQLCSTPLDSNLKRLGKSRKLKKKAPSYGLKTDAVNALLGLRRSGYTKVKHQLYTSESNDRRSKMFTRSSEGGNNDIASASKFTTIDDLPCVLLVHILSFLPTATRIGRVSQVCKKWQAAVLDPSLWRRLDMRNLPRLKDAVLLQLASLSDRVYTLILSDGRSTLLTDLGVSKVLEQCPHLKKVKFNRYELSAWYLSDHFMQKKSGFG